MSYGGELRVRTTCPFCECTRTDSVRLIVNLQPLCIPMRCQKIERRDNAKYDYFSRPKPLKDMDPNLCGPCECDRLECLTGVETVWEEKFQKCLDT